MLIYVPLSHIDDNPFQRRSEYGDIERAWRHIEQKLTLEGDSGVDTYSGEWIWWTDHHAERWTCPNCFEDAVSWQGQRGSCGECGNEMVMDSGELYAKKVADMEPGEETAEPELTMTEVATDWLRTYQDDKGRTWSDLTPSQTHHANSPCYQAFVAAFPAEPEPKLLLKQARAQLERETAVSQEAA